MLGRPHWCPLGYECSSGRRGQRGMVAMKLTLTAMIIRRVGEDQPDPLPSQIPSCRITAAGSSGTTRRASPRSCDPGTQERIAPKELLVGFPFEGLSSRPSVQPLLPDTPDAPIELPQAVVVRG